MQKGNSMERERIYTFMEHPESMDAATVEELCSVIETYPYFQTARLLFTKNLHAIGDERYGNELSRTAVFCADRARLFYLIHSEKYKQLLKQPAEETLSETDRTEALLDSYLQSFQTHSHPNSDTDATTASVGEEHAASIDYLAYLESLGEEMDTGSSQREPFQHQAIIDAFIEKADNDSIRPAPAKEWTAPKEETQEEETNEFLTETLAKIYIKQRKYEQALTIIKRLSLNFPKKSAYFADQIRFLEYLIINEKNK